MIFILTILLLSIVKLAENPFNDTDLSENKSSKYNPVEIEMNKTLFKKGASESEQDEKLEYCFDNPCYDGERETTCNDEWRKLNDKAKDNDPDKRVPQSNNYGTFSGKDTYKEENQSLLSENQQGKCAARNQPKKKYSEMTEEEKKIWIQEQPVEVYDHSGRLVRIQKDVE